MPQTDNLLSKGPALAVFADQEGYTVDNAVVISEALVRKNDFVSLFAKRFQLTGQITKDLPYVSEDKLSHLDDNGVIKVGTIVSANDILIGRVALKIEGKLTDEEKLLRSIFGEKAKEVADESCRMPLQDQGIVIDAKYFPATAITEAAAEVDILIKRELRTGDILDWLAEGLPQFVVAAVFPEDQMPFIPRLNKRAEIIINPAVANGIRHEEATVRFNGGLQKKRKVAEIQLKKIPALCEDKMHARSTGPYHLVSGQPLDDPGSWIQGAVITKSDLAWLASAGCYSILQELLTFKSSSREAFAVYSALVQGERLPAPVAPGILKVLIKSLQGLAINVSISEEHLRLEFASDDVVKSWSYGEIRWPDTLNYVTGKPIQHGLFCQKIFGPIENYCCACGKYSRIRYKGVICEKCETEVAKSSVRRERMGHIALNAPVTHPFNRNILLNVLPVLPPGLRPMIAREGKFLVDDINGLYRNVISRNNRLRRLLEAGAPEQIIQNEKRMLQASVDRLFGPDLLYQVHNLIKLTEEALQALWQKRVDYSGEGVVVPNPDVHESQCGLPVKMALEIFKPIVMEELVQRRLAHNLKSAQRLVDEQKPEIWEALRTAMYQNLIIVGKQDWKGPCYAGFMPILVKGEAIQLNPRDCSHLKIRLDGDKIAVHLPLSRQAQIDAQNIISPLILVGPLIPLQSAFFLESKSLREFLSAMGLEGTTLPLSPIDKLMLVETFPEE